MSKIHSCGYYCDRPECIKAQRDELRDKVEALRKDAERYRWLRDAKYSDAPSGSLVEVWLFNRPTATASSIDAAIDAAMKESK